MSKKVERLLRGQGGNYLFPFFWQHGEDEATLRKYMQVIDASNIKAVCVESRPHPDFCGPKWWADMDIILDEARKREMKVWILDDSHFPTGYANGAMSQHPDAMGRKSICCRTYSCGQGEVLEIAPDQLLHPDPWEPSQVECYMKVDNPKVFKDDRIVGIYAVRRGQDSKEREMASAPVRVNLRPFVEGDTLRWEVPEGAWKVYLFHTTGNMGCHRDYINMMDRDSCKVLLDAVYEPHYERYKEDFGTTIAGFFSDEPELGNGHLYEQQLLLGDYYDIPWSRELEAQLEQRLGKDYAASLYLLWEQEADPDEKARVRYIYMDALTRLIQQNFSWQIGDWCRARGVKYIGHVIEDNNQHARLGTSLGHYYRGLAGQDMAGIDDIGGQVMPQQEDLDKFDGPFGTRIGEFYHYMLGKLGSSAAAIEPLKNGNSMCEIFGAYGWSCGVRLEKYLVDHFLVRGINNYVPHAFSPKEFPDPDCPPHFYAHGHNPQYRHFGALMAYTNRVCELISDGVHIAPAAVVYHGEGEWAGKTMFSHRVGRVLADAQIEYDYIPMDVFERRDDFGTVIGEDTLKVNTQKYQAVIIPFMEYVPENFARAVCEMHEAGITVLFAGGCPSGLCDGESSKSKKEGILAELKQCPVISLEEIAPLMRQKQYQDIMINPADERIRYYHYEHEDHSAIYLLVNEGAKIYRGSIHIGDNRNAYIYDAWDNKCYPAAYENGILTAEIEPLKSLILVLDSDPDVVYKSSEQEFKTGFDHSKQPVETVSDFSQPILAQGAELQWLGTWKRSLCAGINYPAFEAAREITLPDCLAEEEPEFSGFVRYENSFDSLAGRKIVLEIEDAHEGVEVFINGQSMGIQIVPSFVFDLSPAIKEGKNQVIIEVATTLERQMAKVPNRRTGQITEATSLSGITGEVKVYSC